MLNVQQSKDALHYIYDFGQGYSIKFWMESELLKDIKAMPVDAKIYSNAPELIYIFSKKKALFVPFKKETSSYADNDDYSSQLDILKERLKDIDTYLIYVRPIPIRYKYLPSEDELKQKLKLALVKDYQIGAVYNISKRAK